VWFDAGELDAVLSVAAKKLRVPPGAQKSAIQHCPQCPSPLYRFQYPQTYVKIEMCKDCGGLWLDAGEFSEIEAVRKALKMDGELEELAHPDGVKGGLLNFIDTAIEALK
jgi:Zn-finger nucleic acid-binding protein